MKSETMWDRLANNWDKPDESIGENDLRLIEKTHKYLKTSSIVLDYGCATGSTTLEIADMIKEAHGIDISSKMIGIARKKADERKLNNTNFMQATIFDERLQKESFDLILVLNTLHLIKDPAQAINRINKLLKPEGLFISASPCLGKNRFISTLVIIPLFLLSKIGILPHINFFNASGLTTTITNENFQIIENESESGHSINECFIVARKI